MSIATKFKNFLKKFIGQQAINEAAINTLGGAALGLGLGLSSVAVDAIGSWLMGASSALFDERIEYLWEMRFG